MESEWLAFDGEAEGGRYALMCDSDGRSVYKTGGLSTRQCLDFILSGRSTQACVFGLNYDANNWLVDVPEYRLRELWDHGDCTYVVGGKRYRLQWVPAKFFRISIGRGKTRQSVTVNEVWGYFQSSFLRACEAWNLDTQDELAVMKAKRGTFTKAERKRVEAYCLYECKLLSELMGKVQAECERMEIVPKEWIGAGSLARALMESRGVKPHLRHDSDFANDDGLTAILSAYFGGRVEMYAQGDFKNVHTFDINSAYPAAAADLPSLKGAKLKRTTKFEGGYEHAIWRVRWALPESALVTPFPVRVKREIFYPQNGEGWYHNNEVQAAIVNGVPLDILEGYILETPSDEKPFEWIPDVYAERQRLKERKDHGEKVLKLALNSVYGKLAQGRGYRGRSPAFQCYLWAGKITAQTRAMMFDIAARTSPLMISTDGIFLQERANIWPESNELGCFTRGELADLWIGQPGVYWGADHEGVEIVRSRGFFARDIDYSVLRKGYQEHGPEYIHAYESERFIGLGVALQRKDLESWRTWRTERRQISLRATRRLERSSEDGLSGSLKPPIGPMISEPYVPKGGVLTAAPEDHLQGLDQPLKTEA